jgi:carboxymethylenebutenolidase
MSRRLRARLLASLALVASLGALACGRSQSGDQTTTDQPADASAAAPSASDQAADLHAEHAGESPTATPAASTAPAQPVAGETVVYATVGGRQVTGYFSRPLEGSEGLPGVIVIHEWWGLNDNIKAMTDRIAGEGYQALAVDLFGRVATDADQARLLYEGAMKDLPSVRENLRQAHTFLATRPSVERVGSVGWCFGGAISLEAAKFLGPDLWAAVIYYGSVEGDRDRLADVQAPILGLFGGQDRAIPVTSVRAFEQTMTELGKQIEIVVYDQADHAFANPSGQRYDAAAAEDAWQRTRDFLRRRLASAGA